MSTAHPNPTQPMLDELAHYVIAEPYPFVINLEKCHGAWLATLDGREVFDWAGYFGSKLIAHNHPGLSEPEYQHNLLLAANNKTANPDFLTPQCLDYYRLLHQLAPVSMRNPRLEVYAVNSGAEAVENMMKYFINLHHQKLKQSGKNPVAGRFIHFDQAFHGRTIFALNVTELTNDPVITRDFHGFITGNVKVPFPYVDSSRPDCENQRSTDESLAVIERILELCRDEVAGIIVEPLQGAGGHRVALPDFSAASANSPLATTLSSASTRFRPPADRPEPSGPSTSSICPIPRKPSPPPKNSAPASFTCSIPWKTTASWTAPGADIWPTWCVSFRR